MQNNYLYRPKNLVKMTIFRYLSCVLFSLLFLSGTVFSQPTSKITEEPKKDITLEDLWQYYILYFSGGVDDYQSMKDGESYVLFEEGNLNQYSFKSGKLIKTLVSKNELESAGIKDISTVFNASLSEDEKKVLIETGKKPKYRHSYYCNVYVWDINAKKLISVSPQKKVQLPDFSPDGKMVSFVEDNNIFIYNLDNQTKTQVTNDGETNKIINGAPDWVYEEEFSFSKAYFWSPDSKKIAWIRFDESRVKEWNMTIYGKLYPENYSYKYPKAGEDNSVVSVNIYNISAKNIQQADLGKDSDIYIPRIIWTRNPDELCVFRLNRLQNQLDFLIYHTSTNKTDLLFTDTDPYYVDITDNYFFVSSPSKPGKQTTDNPENQYFIYTSEKGGYNQIYLYSFSSGQSKMISAQQVDVTKIFGVDETNKTVYYQAAGRTATDKEIYTAGFDGHVALFYGEKGTSDAAFSKTFNYAVVEWSDGNNPYKVFVTDSKGKTIRYVDNGEGAKSILSGYNFPQKEFITIKTQSGTELNAWMIKPHNFREDKKYPVLFYCYGGPGSNTVNNEWDYLDIWHRMMASKGYIVVSVDNRGTAFRGVEFKKCTYKKLGKLEAEDQIDAARYIAGLPYVDPERIGIWGWSFGGYLSLLSLFKGNDVFKMAVAVAPVTNWRYYDNIYTERFMQKPQDNPTGYDQNSPINYVKNLKGKLLVIHGTADDNVHLQNTMELVNALNNANKQFDMHLYPNKNHSIYGGLTRYHLFTKITNYILSNL